MPSRPGVLLTDAQDRHAPAVCESLSVAGYRVGAVSSERPAPGQWSRFADSRFLLPDPRTESEPFARRLAHVIRDGDFATVLPGSDGALSALSSHRELFPDTLNLGLPSQGVVHACLSKVDLMEEATSAGLSAPETIVCADPDQARTGARRLGYPVLLKPHRAVFSHDAGTWGWASFMAWDEAALEARLADFGFPCLLQRREQGRLLSVGGVMAEEGLLAVAPSRYIRTWRPDAGSVSFSETIDAPAQLLHSIETMLASMGWKGIFELELIETSAGEFAAIDFNPRLYGSLALAVSAGAPLPAVWCDWLLRGSAMTCTARPGVFYRWGDADFRHVWTYLRRGRIADAISVLRPRRGTAHPYLRRHDPAPMLARIAQLLRTGLPKRVGGVLSRQRTPA
jgi:predicted ATP-grasp superfamily ATP-dependent carboligase